MDFKQEIVTMLAAQVSQLSSEEIVGVLEVPSNSEMGDYAFPCFRLAKVLRKSPPIIAQELCEKLEKPSFVNRIEAVGGYVNFFVDKNIFVKSVMEKLLQQKEEYGTSSEGKGKSIVVDYSSPNIAKPFHVGHLRTTVIGNAIYRIYKYLGYECIGVNHLGDWGTQFGKLIVAYKNWGSKEGIEEGGIEELVRIYVKFHDEAEQNAALEDEARAWFVKMQEGDEEALGLWKWFKEISLKEFERIYEILDVTFDTYAGESFYNDKMDVVVDELKNKKLLQESEGAQIVDLSDADMPPCLVIRKDGGTLYATRDITAALYRKNTYDFEKCIYVTALDQSLHFAQFFKVIEKMGYVWHSSLIHVPYGLVSMDTGKLSTRKGNVVRMEDLLREAVEKTKQIIEDKNPTLDNKDEVAEQIGIGAIKFNDLYNSRIKDVVFSWERMLNFDGETGPYVQYTHARCCSVLRKGNFVEATQDMDFAVLTDGASVEVCKLLAEFPIKVKEAADKLEPYIIARWCVNLAQAFNKFYHDNSILVEEEVVKNTRLALVYGVKTCLGAGLDLLGIKAPKQM